MKKLLIAIAFLFALPAFAAPRAPFMGTNELAVFREIAPVFNILAYGASTNTSALANRNAIQFAANVARAVKGTVIIPPGNFKIIAGKPIFLGDGVNVRGEGGRLWVSLPDGYVNNNDYTTPNQTYTATNQLDSTGAYVSWTSLPLTMPWNGKTEVFERAGGVIENVWIDFGWGTTDAPTGVNPITGVRVSVAEQTYYQGFHDSRGAIFKNCTMRNAPGSYISVGYDVTVDNCVFTEYGDHVFYFGQNSSGTQKNYRFVNNDIIANRAEVSSSGNVAYVFQTQREALKFRGNRNVKVSNNSFQGYGSLMIGIRLEVNDASGVQPGDCRDVVVSDNIFTGYNFLDFVSVRSADYATDYRFKNILISGNTANCTNQTAILFRAACDDLKIVNNKFYSGSGGCAFFFGNPRWTDPIKNLVVEGNTFNNSAIFAIGLAGLDIDATFRGNTFENTTASNLITSSYTAWKINNTSTTSLSETVPAGASPASFKSLIIEGNKLENWYASIGAGEVTAYSAATAYPFESLNGGAQVVRCIVTYSGALWVNTADIPATAGNEPGVGAWAAYTQPTSYITFRNNKRFLDGSSLGTASQFLAYITGTTALQHSTYVATIDGDENRNALGQDVGYSLGTVSTSRKKSSSFYDDLYTDKLYSGGNTGLIANYNVLHSVQDFDFSLAGSGDQWSFFRTNTTGGFVDIGLNGATGEKQFRIFTNAIASWILSSAGFIDGVEAPEPLTPSANRLRLFPRDVSSTTELGYKNDAGLVDYFLRKGVIDTEAEFGTLLFPVVTKTSGTTVLVGGTVVVNTASVTANSRIFLTAQTADATTGAIGVSARVASISFTILSTSVTDTNTVAWMLFEP